MLVYQRVNLQYIYISYSVPSILSYLPGHVYIQPIDHSISFHLPEALGILRHAIRPHHGGYPQKRTVAEKNMFNNPPPKKKGKLLRFLK